MIRTPMYLFRNRNCRIGLFYIAVFIATIAVMHLRMPLYGFVRAFLAALFFLDFFIGVAFRRGLSGMSRRWRIFWNGIYFLPFFLLSVFDIALGFSPLDTWPAFFRTYLLGSVLVLLGVHIVYGTVWLLFRAAGLFRCRAETDRAGKGNRRKSVDTAHKTACYVSFFVFLYFIYAMVISTFNLRIDRIDMRQANPEREIPEGLRSYKILQFSDLHIGSFVSPKQIRSLVKQALVTRPDMIVFTGDMVNFSTSEMTPFMAELAHLQAPDGVYCILGNHDYGNYKEWPDKAAKYANLQKMLYYYRKLGWHCLNNASVKIERGGDTLHLVGVENWGKSSRFPKRGNLKKALDPASVIEVKSSVRPYEVSPDARYDSSAHASRTYTILLSHDPSHFDSMVYLRYPKIDLTLAGHTHGMQFGVRVNGKDYSPARLAYEHYSGMYRMANGQALYVNTGCGFNGIPFRLGMRPNLTLFQL